MPVLPTKTFRCSLPRQAFQGSSLETKHLQFLRSNKIPSTISIPHAASALAYCSPSCAFISHNEYLDQLDTGSPSTHLGCLCPILSCPVQSGSSPSTQYGLWYHCLPAHFLSALPQPRSQRQPWNSWACCVVLRVWVLSACFILSLDKRKPHQSRR